MKDVLEIAKSWNSKEAGKALIQAGLDHHKKQFHDQVVGYVSATMERIQLFQKTIEDNERYLQFQRDRLQAISDGKFTVTQNAQVVFDDERLNG